MRTKIKDIWQVLLGLVHRAWSHRRDWGCALLALVNYIAKELRAYLKFDPIIAVLLTVFVVLFLPLVPRNTENPQILASYSSDEPFLSMALEATTEWPFGNPANYFDVSKQASQNVPAHWGPRRYYGIHYYGGAIFQLTWPVYTVLRTIGLPSFPTAPILLRLVSLIAAIAALLILYNIAKLRGWRLAGALAVIYMITDDGFLYYSTNIHPDTTQMLFGLCAFVFATAHCRLGDTKSLIGLGLFCGLVQGAKVGGFWIAPMALVALWIGYQVHSKRTTQKHNQPGWFEATDWKEMGRRALILLAATVMGFLVSTPYAFFDLDLYYWSSLISTLGMVVTDSLNQKEKVDLALWTTTLATKIGIIGTVLVSIVFIRTIVVNLRRPGDPELLLGVTLALSQLLWFGLLSKVWIIIGYLIISIGIISVFAFETLLMGMSLVVWRSVKPTEGWQTKYRTTLWIFLVGALTLHLVSDRWYTTAMVVTEQHLTTRSTVRSLNDWAIAEKLPSKANIVIDDLGYLDRKVFPNARVHGGVLTWGALEYYDPDYIVLSSNLFGAAHYEHLRKTQAKHRQDPDPFNMRLYQELLSIDEKGHTAIPGIKLTGKVRTSNAPPSTPEPTEQDSLAQICNNASGLRAYVCSNPVFSLSRFLSQVEYIAQRGQSLLGQSSWPLTGPDILIYGVNRPGTPDGRPSGFASGTQEGSKASNAFNASRVAWICGGADQAELGCTIGYDFGQGGEQSIRMVQIEWISGASAPSRLFLEYSDDKSTWRPAATLTIAPYPPSMEKYRKDTFDVPENGAHRYWRLRPADAREGGEFAAAEIYFLPEGSYPQAPEPSTK